MEADKNLYTAWLSDNRNKRILYLDDTSQDETAEGPFDIIVIVGIIEYQKDPVSFLRSLKKKLSSDGKIYLYCDNRLALKYFIGEPDPFSGGFGDGLESYICVPETDGQLYSIEQLKDIIENAGLKANIYSVLPDIRQPKFIIADGFKPGEIMSIRYFPVYRHPERIFMNEEYIMDSIIRNNMLPQMAGGLLFELSENEPELSVREIIFSDDRGKSDSMLTIIGSDGNVMKQALYSEGDKKIDELDANLKHLASRGINVVSGSIRQTKDESRTYVMPFVDKTLANEYLQKLFFEDREKFIEEVDAFRECILNASEIIDENGHVQKKAFPDMVPLNAFTDNGKYIFFDQEFCFENYPADAIITRAILIIYELIASMEKELPKAFFFKRYRLDVRLNDWLKLSAEFTDKLITRNQSLLKNFESVANNRRRLNYSESEYEALMYNPVAGLKDKKIYLCGEDDVIYKFTEMYQRDYDIAGVIGKDVSLDELKDKESFRVIICSRSWYGMRRELETKGIRDIAIYLKDKVYPGRQASWLYLDDEKNKVRKKYHIGYVAGVFDLYHMGHLNLLRRAKEQCDYLIVGVVTDAGVRDFKKTEPYIPFEERLELIRSCRYVDEAVEIPYLNRGTIEAFEKYHFDVQFSGSDYEQNELWQYHKKWLEDHGSEMVFLPYTKEISSSRIKELINKELL